MQQGQAYIPIVRFPGPNYGVKNGKFIINPPHLLWVLRQFLFASLKGLSYSHSSVQMQVSIYQVEGNLA